MRFIKFASVFLSLCTFCHLLFVCSAYIGHHRIQIYARAKPTKQKLTGLYEAYEDDNGGSIIAFTVPKDLADGYINNKKEVYKFRFNRVFDQDCKQDEVFEEVAQGVIDNVLTGYNGTIFAYGQTGSGKTFTITGGAERYVDRGLIPRSLSYIFEYFEKHPGTVFTAHISYLEIYNENGYDLLDPKHEASKLEDLPKVTLFEDSDNNVHLKNLSLHQASNEEEALNLLFLGDTNRMIAETPMNQASTRSHCIFTIHVSSRDPGSATIRRAKLHLVDLAGSERVGKTNVGGTLLTEAKYINLSLHYLEQGYHGCAIGKAKQAAKTEIEKLKMKDMTCQELVKEVAKIIYVVHDEVKDKNFELELSWIGEVTNGKHQWVPKDIADAAEKYAKESLEEESSSEDED